MKQEHWGWDYFDRIYCISLEECRERRQSAAAEFSKVGLAGRVEFVLVKRHPSNVEQGMYESHTTCMRKGLEAGAQHILIFEDDIVFDRFDEKRLVDATQYLSKHPNWKVLLLGALIRSSRKTTCPAINQISYQSLAHAYALNRPYADKLACEPWQGIVIDTLFRPLTDHIYAICPMIAFQKDFPSDNKYTHLARFRQLFGGLRRIQKANEFYQQHKFGVVGWHLVLLFLFLLAFFRS